MARQKRKGKRRGFWWSLLRISMTLAVIGGLLFWYVPLDFDFKQRLPSGPNPKLDPESRRLFAKGTKVLVVTAHPDDEAYYIGGTLTKLKQAGAEVTLVACTFGDKGYYGPFADVAGNRRTRRAETEASVKKWGKDVVFLGFMDGRLGNNEDVRTRIAEQIHKVRPDYIMAFDDLYPIKVSHRDHRRAGEAAVVAARESSYQGWLLLFATGAPNYWVDISKLWDAKHDLLAIHASQFSGEKLDLVDLTLQEEAAKAAEAIGVEYAEGFRAVREGLPNELP